MKFIYKARNNQGQLQSGDVLAVDINKAEKLLTQNGLTIVSLEAEQENVFAKINPFGKSVTNKDLVLFSRQLATLISARVPIIQSLRILQEQINGKYLLAIIGDLIASVENKDQ